ncbi:MAG TPA: ETC complex I subunit [Beijerinckiaceae bacterium]|nr:ETC complex I subunit [Beijerinckiaceae bacterium]
MTARIYKPARNAMQSGQGKTVRWLLEFEPAAPRQVEPLMGWTSATDMDAQVRLWFDSKEAAVAYAEKHGLAYRVEEPKETTRRSMAYADNFKFNRTGQWTH